MVRQQRDRRRKAAHAAMMRDDRRTRQKSRKRLRRWFYLAASGIIALLVTISLFLPSISPERSGGERDGGPGEIIEQLQAVHISNEITDTEYNSIPPTSGPHWDFPSPWGVYSESLPNERQVHNLEHGGMVIQYNTDDAALITQLEQFAKKQRDYPCYLLVAPYPTMPYTIAATAWGVRSVMEVYDETRLQNFFDAYRNNGPERVGCTPD